MYFIWYNGMYSGQLTIIKMSDFYKYEHLFKNAGVSAFKVVVNS